MFSYISPFFLYKKVKVKKLLFDFFSFSVFHPLLMFYFCLLLCRLSSNFQLTCIFFEKIFCFVFKESTLQCLKKIQVQITVFNKKAVVNISRISNSKRPPWNLVKFRSEFFLVDISRIVCCIFLVLIVN